MSAIAGLSWWRLYLRVFGGAIKSGQIIEFLAALRRQIRKKLLTIWDGGGVHKGRRVRNWLVRNADESQSPFFPRTRRSSIRSKRFGPT